MVVKQSLTEDEFVNLIVDKLSATIPQKGHYMDWADIIEESINELAQSYTFELNFPTGYTNLASGKKIYIRDSEHFLKHKNSLAINASDYLSDKIKVVIKGQNPKTMAGVPIPPLAKRIAIGVGSKIKRSVVNY